MQFRRAEHGDAARQLAAQEAFGLFQSLRAGGTVAVQYGVVNRGVAVVAAHFHVVNCDKAGAWVFQFGAYQLG